MRILVKNGRLIDPTHQLDEVIDIAIADGKVLALGRPPHGTDFDQVIDASGYWVLPGLIDLSVRLLEPGDEHVGMLASEVHAALAGGVTSLVCPPDTDPVLDEPGLVRMLRDKADKMKLARVFPLGALTIGLKGEALTEMMQLAKAGCVGFSQAEVPVVNTQFLLRAFQYAGTFDQTIWLRPTDPFLGGGAAASGAVATRLGLSGSPVASETIALCTMIELVRATACKLHICKLSTARGVEMVRQAKRDGLPITCDVSVNSLHLTDMDLGFFDSRARLNPPLRQASDRQALQLALADGTIDALVSDHHPVLADAKAVPFASAAPGATGVEMLLSLAIKWAQHAQTPIATAVAALTSGPIAVLGGKPDGNSFGHLGVGAQADLCLVDPVQRWTVTEQSLVSQGKSTPFLGYELPARVMATMVGGQLAFDRRSVCA